MKPHSLARVARATLPSTRLYFTPTGCRDQHGSLIDWRQNNSFPAVETIDSGWHGTTLPASHSILPLPKQKLAGTQMYKLSQAFKHYHITLSASAEWNLQRPILNGKTLQCPISADWKVKCSHSESSARRQRWHQGCVPEHGNTPVCSATIAAACMEMALLCSCCARNAKFLCQTM